MENYVFQLSHEIKNIYWSKLEQNIHTDENLFCSR